MKFIFHGNMKLLRYWYWWCLTAGSTRCLWKMMENWWSVKVLSSISIPFFSLHYSWLSQKLFPSFSNNHKIHENNFPHELSKISHLRIELLLRSLNLFLLNFFCYVKIVWKPFSLFWDIIWFKSHIDLRRI